MLAAHDENDGGLPLISQAQKKEPEEKGLLGLFTRLETQKKTQIVLPKMSLFPPPFSSDVDCPLGIPL